MPISLQGASVDEDYATLYAIFTRDILAQPLQVDGFPVALDTGIDPYLTPYERGFAHLVTRANSSGIRLIDYARASKLCWVRPVIDNYTDPAVRSFWYAHSKEEVLYLWLHEYDFVVILKWMGAQSKRTRKVLVTAYDIDPSNRIMWERRYRNAARVL
jgi:hypothetical protein